MKALRGCTGTEDLPVKLAEDDWYYSGKQIGDMKLKAVFTSVDSVTAPHLNDTGCGNLVLCLYGWKVLCWWDGT